MQKINTDPNTTQAGLTNQSVFGLKYSMSDLCLYTPCKYNVGENVTTTFLEFAQRLNKRMGDIIDENFDWTNILIAGGLISGLLEKKFDEESYKGSDIDLFVYGPNKQTIIERIIAIYDYFAKKLNNKFYAFVNGASTMISIIIPRRSPIQIIGTEYKSPNEILNSFDMTHCQAGFNGNQIICTDEFIRAITSKITKITTSSIHAYRLVKAYKRGYSIQRPKYCHIKNIFHEYTTTFVLDKNSKIPSNTDKFYDIHMLQSIISELSNNPIVIKNLTKNYVPLTGDPNILEDELRKIGVSYAGEKKYTFINDHDHHLKYTKDGIFFIVTLPKEKKSNDSITYGKKVRCDIRDLLMFQRKLF